MMDMRFWWLQCRASQDQFQYYWDAGSKTGLITTPNITQTPTMKPTGQLMLVSGNRLAPKSTANFAKPLAQGFPLQVFPFYFYFFQSTEHYFPTL